MGSDLLVGWGSAVCLQELLVPVSFFSGFHLQSKDKFFQLTGDYELSVGLTVSITGSLFCPVMDS